MGEVDQNHEGSAGASAHGSLPRGPLPTIPITRRDPRDDWPDGPKTEPQIVVEQLRKVQRRVVQVMAQDEHGNEVPINFFLESEPEDDDRFVVRGLE